MSYNENKKASKMRTLYIGLGGTGGKVLLELYKHLNADQKNAAKSIYLDLDKKDTSMLEALGVTTIRISSAALVRDIAASLGPDDGVYNWLPHEQTDSHFLGSRTDDGASQNRYKSRLCLAKFLNNPSNELKRKLSELCPPGSEISNDTLRVMIVSSVAGGTGSGTFIQVALYVRKFFRDIGHPEIRIMGLFSLPELYAQTLTREGGDNNKRISMFANAYAAVRELNAMNLTASGGIGENGYGKYINMRIESTSETCLFDSKKEPFSNDPNAKPFDLLYFIDLANQDGGILGDLDHYYKTMADVAYTRLYSKLETTVRSNESNELSCIQQNPTAIYGSAGYARIIYPYEDILRYLAEAKTLEELDTKWFLMETKWANYVMRQQKIAGASGRVWTTTPKEREQVFITAMEKELKSTSSIFQSILPAVGLRGTSEDRVEQYFTKLNNAVHCASGLSIEDTVDGSYSLGQQEAVANALTSLITGFNTSINSNAKYLERLEDLSATIQTNMTILGSKFAEAIPGAAVMLAGAILPSDTVSAKNALAENDPVNLYNSLLRMDGKDVHPIAARYLLYRVRQQIRNLLEANTRSFDEKQKQIIRSLELCLDTNPDDGDDTVADIAEDISKAFWGREKLAEASLSDFVDAIPMHIMSLIGAATDELLRQTYGLVLESLDVLISQYEGLYDNMDQYRNQMRQRVERDLNLYADDDERDIYICASPKMLQHYYYQQPSVSSALASGNEEIYSAAGKSIYEALTKKTWEILKEKDAEHRSQGAWKPSQSNKDRYSDLGHVFDEIVKNYAKYLRERATYLQVPAITALYRQACLDCGIDENQDIRKDATMTTRIHAGMKLYFDDLEAKAIPLLRYTKDLSRVYSSGKQDCSILYQHLGFSHASETALADIYTVGNNESPCIVLKNALGFPSDPQASNHYDDHEIFCFSAIHCLQPTQIFMFREDVENSYYSFYQQRLAVALANHSMSDTPHIDKHWHVRGAIPYISPKLEMEWNEKTMKALLYLMLQRQICFDYDQANNPRFFIKLNGHSDYIEQPAGSVVTKSTVSRVLEYLANQESLVEELAAKLDIIVNYQVSTLSNHTDSMAVYKGQMTRNELLRRLRSDLLVYEPRESEVTAGHGKNARKANSNQASEEEAAWVRTLYAAVAHEENEGEPVMDQKKTMGGLLEFAWLLHKSEERLGEDRDFGEALMLCATKILDKFCTNMYGDKLNPNSVEYKNYVNLYNSAATRFLLEYVVATARRRKLVPEQMVVEDRNQMGLGPAVTEGNTLKLDIPTTIRNTEEFGWVDSHWSLKGDVLKR